MNAAPPCAAWEMCLADEQRCAQCRADADCGGGLFCEDERCVQCRVDDDCGDGWCELGRCVECRADEDCQDGVFCNGAEMCVAGVCASTLPACSPYPEVCVEETESCGE